MASNWVLAYMGVIIKDVLQSTRSVVVSCNRNRSLERDIKMISTSHILVLESHFKNLKIWLYEISKALRKTAEMNCDVKIRWLKAGTFTWIWWSWYLQENFARKANRYRKDVAFQGHPVIHKWIRTLPLGESVRPFVHAQTTRFPLETALTLNI